MPDGVVEQQALAFALTCKCPNTHPTSTPADRQAAAGSHKAGSGAAVVPLCLAVPLPWLSLVPAEASEVESIRGLHCETPLWSEAGQKVLPGCVTRAVSWDCPFLGMDGDPSQGLK